MWKVVPKPAAVLGNAGTHDRPAPEISGGVGAAVVVQSAPVLYPSSGQADIANLQKG
ncbi:hypothetical protein [Nonomuraea rubra]|uniref:Uncharacterized protein n=1 Tax=Nonomuraea rubra TaxID=46180 RepID=A0A7X0NV36_9ACTN|nr:hypothetical protein [Nonomuraea rubra]MBB6550135.1 hypothetical protein [Nonomuraea rubra]